MRCARSWFNATLYKKNLTRFWPVWGVYLLIWVFVFPVNLVLDNYSLNRFAYKTVLEYTIDVGLPMALIFALLSAVAVWSYLCNYRSACMIHTLPIRREGLFFTNFLSGMTFMVGPNLIVFVLTLLAEAATGVVDVGALAVWLLCVSLMELFFFCFATFCAMLTGHILGLPAFYAIFNGLAAGLTMLIDLTLSRFVFGYTGLDGAYTLARWLTPVWNLYSNLEVRVEWTADEMVPSTAWLSGIGFILVYVFFGLILAALALVLYRRRHMERAGDVITVSWMRPVFQYGVAFCCALAFGSLLFEMFRYNLSDSAWLLLLFMMLCAAVGWFVAKMLLEKSFRVFGCWKGCLPLLAALAVLTCVMEFDLTGYERRIPDAADVVQISISDVNTAPYDSANWLDLGEVTDPEIIQAALAVHQTIVDSKNEIERDPGGGWGTTMEAGYSVETRGYAEFDVSYLLKNGKSIRREYTFTVLTEDLDDDASLTAKLDALVNLPQVIDESYGLSDEKADDIIEMNLSSYALNSDEAYLGYSDVAISKDAYEKVFEAVLLDLEEGNLGRRYLLDDEQRMNTCLANDLEIVFYRGKLENTRLVAETSANGSTKVVDREVLLVTETVDAGFSTQRITITLQTTAKHTLAALKETGVLTEPVGLMTKAQAEALDNKWYSSEKYDSEVIIDPTAYVWDTIGE